MVYPTKPDQAYDFETFQSGAPTTPLPANQVSDAFAQHKASIDGAIDFLKVTIRSDNKISANMVPAGALMADALLLMGAWTPRGAWATATTYAVRDLVTRSGVSYVCLLAHTSGTFSTDLAASKWQQLSVGIGSSLGNTWAGEGALAALTIGDTTTAFGKNALAAHTTETYSAAFGHEALLRSIGHANTGFGAGAGGSFTTTYDSVAFGADAGRNADRVDATDDMTGDNNALFGVHAGGHITSGRFNVFVGNYSGVGGGNYVGFRSARLTGSYNVGTGHLSLATIQGVASENVANGYSAGHGLTIGNKNIFLGPYAGRNTTSGDLNIFVGRDVQATSITASNELNIGNLIRGSGLEQGGAPSTGKISIGLVDLSINPSNTLHVYNATQAGLRLDTGAGVGLYFTDFNQQTDGVLNIIPPAAGYVNISGNAAVTGGLTLGASAIPLTLKTNTAGGLLLFYAAGATNPNATILMNASRGTVAAPTVVVNGDLLATPMSVKGYDGNTYESAARIAIYAGGAVSDGVVPGYMEFSTATTGGVLTAAMAIDATQRVKILSGKEFWLGNAYTGGDPTTTGYMLIYDVNGVAYEVPAKAH